MSLNDKSLVLLGASYMAGIFLDKAKAMGIKTYCFAWEQGAVAKEHADVFFPISIMEKEIIEKKCLELNVDGIISTTEAPIATCGYLVDKLRLNGNGYDVSKNITNKGWVRNKASGCSILKQPKYSIIYTRDDIIDWDSFQFPVVIKPVCGGGKKGVVVCNTQKDVNECLNYSFSYDSKNNGVLIEEYISAGQEYSVESISYKGNHQVIQITEKISSGPPYCVELGHHQPAYINSYLKDKIRDAVIELLNSVSFINGPAHVEIKIVNEEVYLIELNARPGGDHIATKLTQLSTGYDYIANCIRVALDIKPEIINNDYCKYAGVYFVTKQTAFLKDVFDKCDKEDWLFEKHIESNDLEELTHNDCTHTNYMIYCSNQRVDLNKQFK